MKLTPRDWSLGFGIVLLLAGSVLAAPDKFLSLPAAVQPFVDQGEISGAVMLVATKDKVLHVSAVGQSDLASGRKLQTDDLFWIASMSKPITAVCVALLADDGKLSFDDPLEKFLPEYRYLDLKQEQAAERRMVGPITLRHLLTHTSGIGEYRVTAPHWTLAEMSRALAREPLRFEPGIRWAYSTAGIDTLGRVVEVVSGMPFAAFMQQRLLDPLGMTHTTFWPTLEQKKRLATSYRMNASGKLAETTISYMYGGEITDAERPALGGAGLFSTAEDVRSFTR
jgi:CubicO group peptidase (beta-lactamase class C family)